MASVYIMRLFCASNTVHREIYLVVEYLEEVLEFTPHILSFRMCVRAEVLNETVSLTPHKQSQ